MDFNTRKAGPPEPIGEHLHFTQAEIEKARSKPGSGRYSDITQRVLDAVRAILPPEQHAHLSQPVVRYQQIEPGVPLDGGPAGWHIDFAQCRPRTLYLFVNDGPPTQFLRDSPLESPVDPDQQQLLFNAHVAQEVVAGLQTWEAPIGRIMRYDNREAHRSQIPTGTGWRYFFRVWAPA